MSNSPSILQGLASAGDPLAEQATGPQPTGFNGPQGSTYDSGVARVPAPQVPMAPTGQQPALDAEPPSDEDLGIHPVDKMAGAFIDHLIDKDKAAQPTPPPGSFGEKLKGALNAAGAGLGDMRTGADPRSGWLGAVGATLNARQERKAKEQAVKFEQDERLKTDQINLARANSELAMHARTMGMQDKVMRDSDAKSGAEWVDHYRKGYQVTDNVSQDQLNKMMEDPAFARTHTARTTGWEPVLNADGSEKKDANGLTVETPTWSIINMAPGERDKTITVDANAAKRFKDAGLGDWQGQVLPGTKFNEMGVQADRINTTLGILNKDRLEAIPDDVKDQLITALGDSNVQHAVASYKGNAIGGLFEAQSTVGQLIDRDTKQLAAAQASGNANAAAKLQADLTHQKNVQQNLDKALNLGFTDKEKSDYWKEQNTEAKEDQQAKERARQQAETERHNRATELFKAAESGGPEQIGEAAQMLVGADEDPSQLSKRAKGYQPTINAANDLSWKQYGKPWSAAQAQTDYKYANQKSTQDTLKLINGITDPGGSLEIAMNASRALPQIDSQTLNKVFNIAGGEFGNKAITDFHTAMLGLADEYSKVMGGGVSSDLGRQQALDLLKAAYSKSQFAGAEAVIRKDINARTKGLVGNNRYLQRQVYGPQGITTTVVAPNGEKMEVNQRDLQHYLSKGAHVQTKTEYEQSLGTTK